MEVIKFCVALFFALECCYFTTVEGVALEIDLYLSDEQKLILDKFQKIMAPKVPHKYMQEEIYLVRWLRARQFDIKRAEEMLLQGRPIARAISREWDLRNAVLTGRINRGLRYLDGGMDMAAQRVRDLQRSGQNVTQFILILHLGNFNLYQHGCPRCITGILEFIDSYENHYPGMAHEIFLVQTPPVFEAIAQLVKEAASPATREALKIYGIDRKHWQSKLLEGIAADQLTEEFGGTRPE